MSETPQNNKPSELETISRAMILRGAIRHASKKARSGRPLWALVRDICCVGSTRAIAICRELDWDPHQDATTYSPF